MAVVLLGGGEWSAATAPIDARVLEAGMSVAVVAAAAAFENQAERETTAIEHLAARGMRPIVVPVSSHRDAQSPVVAAELARADAIYLGDGSAMHLRAVLRRSLLWDEIAAGASNGKPVVASGAAAEVVCDPMVDPRGGGFTVGLGLVNDISVIAGAELWSEEKTRRCAELAPPYLPIAALCTDAGLASNNGAWQGEGRVVWWKAGLLVAAER